MVRSWKELNDILVFQQPDTPVKRGKVGDDKPSKKFKDSGGKGASTPTASKIKNKLSQVQDNQKVRNPGNVC